MKKRLIAMILLAGMLFCQLPVQASATETQAEDITKETTFSGTGYSSFGFLKDGSTYGYLTSNGNAEITLENEKGIASLYLMFDLEYGEYTIVDNASEKEMTAGKYEFLHEYVALEEVTTSLTIRFDSGKVRLGEIYVFTEGTPPEFVQRWDAPLEGKTDLMLLATHGDDDQLFFAGLMPYYAGELDIALQVVYLTDHRNMQLNRTHEMLNGLWAVGVKAYPVFGSFADFRIDSLQGTYDHYASLGTTKEDLQSFVVEQIRRFKPQVAVGHDLRGEYGHGMHMVYAELLTQALDLTGDEEKFPESAEKYGTWEIPKTYLHLYKENPIVMDWDVELTAFDGMTALQVSQKLGFPCHKSQQNTWFRRWLNYVGMQEGGTPITSATQIATYSPCQYGLYRSLVGADVEKNDFLENIVTYEEQARLEAERLEQERLEQERLEQERLEQERKEQERLEAERKEQERLEQERLEKEKVRKEFTIAVLCLIVLVVLLIGVLIYMRVQNIRRHKKCQARQKLKNNL